MAESLSYPMVLFHTYNNRLHRTIMLQVEDSEEERMLFLFGCVLCPVCVTRINLTRLRTRQNCLNVQNAACKNIKIHNRKIM